MSADASVRLGVRFPGTFWSFVPAATLDSTLPHAARALTGSCHRWPGEHLAFRLPPEPQVRRRSRWRSRHRAPPPTRHAGTEAPRHPDHVGNTRRCLTGSGPRDWARTFKPDPYVAVMSHRPNTRPVLTVAGRARGAKPGDQLDEVRSGLGRRSPLSLLLDFRPRHLSAYCNFGHARGPRGKSALHCSGTGYPREI